MSRELAVWLLGDHVGTLVQVDGRLNFVYRPGWLERASGHAGTLSQSLPLRAEPFDDRATRPFFAGLLPEGEQRRLVAQALQASRQNDFALLEGIGGECAGAVTLLEPGQIPGGDRLPAPEEPDSSRVRWLEEASLLDLLAEMPQRPMLAGQEGLRLSLAGAQDKLPVVVDLGDGSTAALRIGLPLFGAPSTHILKPSIPGVEGSVHNEAFCMNLAGALNLRVANTRILKVADRQVLLVQRYDRLASAPGQPPVRLHQEDFCQALGVPPEHKYQNEGGPDLAQCFALLRKATRPSAPHILALLDAVVFNALIGNHDAHGKNFSLLYEQAGARLAPLYDLLCTATYPTLTEKMAMKLGGKYKFTEIMPRHWQQFARDAGLSPAQVTKRVLDLARRLPVVARSQLASFEKQGMGHPILSQLVGVVVQRCELVTYRMSQGDAANP